MARPLEVEFVAVHTVEDDWYMDALADTMSVEGDRLRTELGIAAPIKTGALRGSITVDLHPDGMMVRAGQHYGTYLDASSRYHYIGGQRAGDETRGWFSDTTGQFPASIMTPWVRLIERVWDG